MSLDSYSSLRFVVHWKKKLSEIEAIVLIYFEIEKAIGLKISGISGINGI
jgi:hypothetical protein